ncbi:salicylate synthase [Rhodococcoides kyotonense]|uniref:Salicylate synthetase n=1 Tax=Rhodococcoides kyotonense TaxID=398843 RepID=A0A239N4E3_9NOCA|nr:salicylate synthase [Rhodococcus kyotonensis]SNT49324.1 salicylate synthetase [Rhodococcus kyotonensis]
MTAVIECENNRDVTDTLRGARVCASWAAAGLAPDYVVYERHGRWVYAGGSRASIMLRRNEIRTVTTDGERASAWTGRPAQALAAALAGLGFSDWRAYGWLGFDFGSPGLGAGEHIDDAAVLAHLVVPKFEAWIDADGITFTGVDADTERRMRELAAVADHDDSVLARTVDVGVDDSGYRSIVADAIAEIRSGLYEKVILSRTIAVPFDVDIPRTYVRGRTANNPARSFLFRMGGLEATGFSPELVGSVGVDRALVAEPLAGTRAFGRGPELDRIAREDLVSDAKEIAEHAVSVRTSFAEVDGIAAPGTTAVTQFMVVRERGSVQHLASTVRGTLAPETDAWDGIEAVFPSVTASGVPKAEAVDAIYRLEGNSRGLYSGAVVTASSNGEVEAALALRTVFREDGEAWIRAGAGIVAQSDPDREFEETCEKLASVAPHLVERSIPGRQSA